jgi:AraC-like DNA-binding protein
MIASRVATGLLEAIRAAGADPDEILKKAGVNRAALDRADGFIECSSFARLLESAAAATGDQAFGLHFGARANPKNTDALGYAVLNSPTVAAAFETAGRYLHLHNEAAEVAFTKDDELGYLRYNVKNLDLDRPRQFVEYSMAAAFITVRFMVGSQWSPREVQFAHAAPEQTSAHRELFRAPVLFGCPSTAFVLERGFCDQPIPAADPNLFKIMRRYLDGVLRRVPKEDQTLTLIRRQIAQGLKGGNPELIEVAKLLALSPRTLQRQLRSCGMNFKALVDDTRRRFAIDYLKDSDNTLTQIAFLLGYSEVSAFNRSFKRWTGKTPAEYRRESIRQ